MIFLSKGVIFRFHVSFLGSISILNIHSPEPLSSNSSTSKTWSSAKVQAAFAKCRDVNSTGKDLRFMGHGQEPGCAPKMPTFRPMVFMKQSAHNLEANWDLTKSLNHQSFKRACSSFALQQWDHFCHHWNALCLGSWSHPGVWSCLRWIASHFKQSNLCWYDFLHPICKTKIPRGHPHLYLSGHNILQEFFTRWSISCIISKKKSKNM